MLRSAPLSWGAPKVRIRDPILAAPSILVVSGQVLLVTRQSWAGADCSFVRSVTMDKWSQDQLNLMSVGGNAKLKCEC